MKIQGTWYVVPSTETLGSNMDRSKMEPIEFHDGVITLADGSHPSYEQVTAAMSAKGYATLTFNYLPTEAGQHTRIVIDCGSDRSLGGTLYVSDTPLPAGSLEGVPGVRQEPLRICSIAYLEQSEADNAALAAGDWPFGPAVELDEGATDGLRLVAVGRR